MELFENKIMKCWQCEQEKNIRFPFFGRLCDDCQKENCKKGIHTWDPACIGPGIFLADCLWCDATTEDAEKGLEHMGFKKLETADDIE